MAERVAFLIGNQTFRRDSGLLPLQGPANDIAALTRLLRDPARGNFEVHEFLDKTQQEVLLELELALHRAAKGDLFLIYYSGHGKLAPNGELCLATVDTRQNALHSTSISTHQLRGWVNDSNCEQVVLLLDCCYSGAVGAGLRGDVGSALRVAADASGFFMMTACTGIQSTRETAARSPDSVVMGLFTDALVNGIESGAADQQRTGEIRLYELRDYLQRVITGSTPQFFAVRASGNPLISFSPATHAVLLGAGQSAAVAPGKIGAAAVPALLAALKDPAKNVQQSAAAALVEIGPAAVPALVAAVKNLDEKVRRSAAAAAVPALAAALKDSDKDKDVQQSAAEALVEIGLFAPAEAVSALAAILKRWVYHPENHVPQIAAKALGEIGLFAPAEAAPALATALNSPALTDRDNDIWRIAAAALSQMGPAAVLSLAAALKDNNDKNVRSHAAAALGEIGPDAREVVPALAAALKDFDTKVRSHAAAALGNIGPDAREAVPALAAALKDFDYYVVRTAAAALGKIGPDAREAVPALGAILQDPDEEVCRIAAVALDKMRLDAGLDAVPATVLFNPANNVRNSFGNSLKEDLRWTAAEALVGIGPAAMPALSAALKDPDKNVRRTAAAAMHKIEPNAEAGLALLEDPDYNVPEGGASALQRILGQDS
jgi:HEAT repeat protein